MALSAATAPTAAHATYAPAESAAIARREWAAMRAARTAGDREAAVTHAARAHAAWPGQWAYAYGLASVAAAANDGEATARGLSGLVRLGAFPNLEPDTALVRLARSAGGRERGLDRHLENIARGARPSIRSRGIVFFPERDSAFWPEGLAFDPRTKEYFVAGVRRGEIAVVKRGGSPRTFARLPDRGWSALALGVDVKAGLVWVSAAALPQSEFYQVADSGRAALFAFDRSNGKVRRRFDLPAAQGGHIPGDVLVARNGDVYVSDSTQPVIYRVRQERLEQFVTDPAFRSLQGQAFDPSEQVLYVADYSHGIAAVDLATRAVRWLMPPEQGTVLGIDGLAWVNGGLVAVQNGISPPRLVRIFLDEADPIRVDVSWMIDQNLEFADEPTLVVADDDGVTYVANSHWEKYDGSGVRQASATLRAPVLLHLSRPGDRSPSPQSPVDSPIRDRLQEEESGGR